MSAGAGWAAANLTESEGTLVAGEWFAAARAAQYPLYGTRDIWLVLGGRGAGKTRLGAEWVNAMVRGLPPFAEHAYGLVALVGETLADVRDVMIEGPSGILATARDDRPRFEPSRRRVCFDNGAVAQIFSSEDPDSLRGPQFEAAWCDELGKWRHPDATFDMLQFGLRLGKRPRQIITTTPRPTAAGAKARRRQSGDGDPDAHGGKRGAPGGRVPRRGASRYAGPRLGRQELDGEIITERQDALWSRALLEKVACRKAGELNRIVVAVDPPASAGRASHACGIVAAGLDREGRAVVLADATVSGAKPREWASAAVLLYHRLEADCLVAETNQGGDMVAAVIATVDPGVPVKGVRARRGKWLRAEPVAALYGQGRVRHAGRFPELEDEMCDFGPNGLSGGRSPDRVDALVWAIGELMPRAVGEPRIRVAQ